MTISYGDVPLIDPVTGRFPDSFAPPSVGADAAAAAQSATSAAASASQAANSASTASTKATEASTSATNAASSASDADASATAAASSAATASAAQEATEAVDITVGTVTTGAPDTPAAAEIVGTAPNFTLDLTIPRGDKGDKGDPAPATTAPPRIAAYPRPTWRQTFQAGHGWTDPFGGATLTADTGDYLLGTQSLSVATTGAGAAQKSGLALDLTGSALILTVKTTSLPKGVNFHLYAASSAAMTAYRVWSLATGGEPSPRFQLDEWATIALPWELGVQVGSLDRAAIDTIRIRTSNTGAFKLQSIGTVPIPTRTGSVSFSFDDGYSSVMAAARVLGARGIAGTLYMIPAGAGTAGYLTTSELRTLQDVYGWDIEAHGSTTYTTLTAAQMRSEWVATREWFAAHGLGCPRHLAYVGGQSNATVVATAREFFSTGRTIAPGIETHPPTMPYRMRAYSAISSHSGGTSIATAQAAIDQAVAGGHHATLVFHRIGAVTSTMECSEADLGTLADYAVSAGADVRTIADLFR